MNRSRATVVLVLLIGLHAATTETIVELSKSSEIVRDVVETESLSKSSKDSLSSAASEESQSKEDGMLLKFLLRPVDNDAVIYKGSELYLHRKDNENDNNDSNTSVELNSREKPRFRREKVKTPVASEGGNKVIATSWGTYEEQVPIVVESRNIDPPEEAHDDESASFSDELQSRESDDSGEYTNPAGESSISYEEYEDGGFQGRQFYPSRGGGYDSGEQQEQPDNYYRQKYYATTPRPVNPSREPLRGEEAAQQPARRPQYPSREDPQRPQYRQPQQKEEEEPSGIMGFVQKAKTFYDIFRAINSAWKTVEDHYRKNGQGIFPEDLKKLNITMQPVSTTTSAPTETTQKNNNNKQQKTKRPKPTKAPIKPAEEDEHQEQEKEERSRRSSKGETVAEHMAISQQITTTVPEVVDGLQPTTEDPQSTESDLKPTESDASSTTTAVAEGRYIKGDPLKGYYDFVITEGSYKFWAAFQVGTAVLIIYSTFAAIYYSKVNPLVSDYDYIDYLGGGRSLSDDSDFVDTDVPTKGDGSKTATAVVPEGASKSRQQQQQAGWFSWLPHAGHTLRFILESIDKGYNEE